MYCRSEGEWCERLKGYALKWLGQAYIIVLGWKAVRKGTPLHIKLILTFVIFEDHIPQEVLKIRYLICRSYSH